MRANFKEIYEKNRVALNEYKWWRHETFPDYENLSIKAEIYHGDKEYFFRIGEKTSKTITIERANINTKPFFRDLDKPLLIKNEFNTYNIEYVVDNVRKSEDFGGDNHIYLYYDDIKDFTLFLQVSDITEYLKDNKIVFIFGEEDLSVNYPLNFKGIYGIDYEGNLPKPVGLGEIKRIFLTWSIRPASGVRTFFYPLLEQFQNTVYFPRYSLTFDRFVAIYKCFLQGRTVQQFAECFFTEFKERPGWGGKWKDGIRALFASEEAYDIEDALNQKFWQTLFSLFPRDYVPNEIEWLKAFALAKAAEFGQNLKARIAPALTMFFNDTTQKTSMIEKNVLPVLRKFKYIRIVSIIRRLTINAGANIDDHKLDRGNLLCGVVDFIRRWRPNYQNLYFDDFFISSDDEFLPVRKIMRFEDLKLEPVASFEALCDFFDITIDENFLNQEHWFKNPNSGEITKGFSTNAVFNLHETRFSHYDYYRLELIMGKAYEYYGYKPMYYTDGKKYSDNEIMEMFKQPFKVEEFNVTKKQVEDQDRIRYWLYYRVKYRLNHPFDEDENGAKLVPIPWLKPKEEFMTGKLYR